MTEAVIELKDVSLTLGEGASSVHVLKGVSLDVGSGRGDGHRRAVRLRQVDAADGAGRPGTGRFGHGANRRRAAQRQERGPDCCVSRPQHRHRLPVLPPHPQHDGAGKCRRAAGAGRPCRPVRAWPRANWRRSASATASPIIPASCPAASSSAWRSPARWRPSPRILIADEPTGNLDQATGRQIADLLFAKAAERGMTLVLVTHDPALAARCSRQVAMRSGRIEAATAARRRSA